MRELPTRCLKLKQGRQGKGLYVSEACARTPTHLTKREEKWKKKEEEREREKCAQASAKVLQDISQQRCKFFQPPPPFVRRLCHPCKNETNLTLYVFLICS